MTVVPLRTSSQPQFPVNLQSLLQTPSPRYCPAEGAQSSRSLFASHADPSLTHDSHSLGIKVADQTISIPEITTITTIPVVTTSTSIFTTDGQTLTSLTTFTTDQVVPTTVAVPSSSSVPISVPYVDHSLSPLS